MNTITLVTEVKLLRNFANDSSSNHPQASNIKSSIEPNLESCSSTELHALLNRTSTIKEIKNVISRSKTGKSPGVDMISNEMLNHHRIPQLSLLPKFSTFHWFTVISISVV